MKKFLILFALIIIVLFNISCTKNYEIILPDWPVGTKSVVAFNVNPIEEDIEISPMTRNGLVRDRMINYSVYSASSEIKVSTIKENYVLEMELPIGGTYNTLFYYSDKEIKDGLTIVNENIFIHDSTFTVNSDYSQYNVKLTRAVGKFTALVGHIPTNHTVSIEIAAANRFNVYSNSALGVHEIVAKGYDLIKGKEVVAFAAPGEKNDAGSFGHNVSCTVKLYKNGNDEPRKQKTYSYTVHPNRQLKVTYSINNVTEGDSWLEGNVSIDDNWDAEDNEHQQIGG